MKFALDQEAMSTMPRVNSLSPRELLMIVKKAKSTKNTLNEVQGESMIRTSRNKNSAPAGGDPIMSQTRALKEGQMSPRAGVGSSLSLARYH